MNDYVEITPELIGISDKQLVKMDHSDHISAVQTIASPPPQHCVNYVAELVAAHYGLEGDLKPLVGERDQNFRLITNDGTRFVIKIANAAEETTVTEFQIEALLHIEKIGCPVTVPRIVRTSGGATSTMASQDGTDYVTRVVSFVPGRPLGDVAIDADLARRLGQCLATLGVALRGFEHPGDSQVLLWDMRRATALRGLMPHINDMKLRTVVGQCLDEFQARSAPRLASVRSQVIHNDLNPGNVLVEESKPLSIAGVIDFGDMIRAPLIIDVAVAASYLRSDDTEPLALLMEFLAGYDSVTRLEDIEIELLYDLVRTRLATTITIIYWRSSLRADDDAYTIKSLYSEKSAGRFLQRLNAIPERAFADRIRQQCGR